MLADTPPSRASSLPQFLTHPAECYQGQHRITGALGEGHDQQEPPQRLTHDASDQGQRITDHGHPTEQQRPMTVALIMLSGRFKMPGADRKPAPLAKALDAASQPPVQQRAEDIAQ